MTKFSINTKRTYVIIVLLCIAIWLGYNYYQVPYEEEKVPVKLEQPEFFLADTPTKELV